MAVKTISPRCDCAKDSATISAVSAQSTILLLLQFFVSSMDIACLKIEDQPRMVIAAVVNVVLN